MATVGIHPPKTPVTKGSRTIAKATIPNVCKMPGPPAPFVPSPLPNIAKSELSPKGYSTTVKIEGNTVAIRGATFESIGDMASKGTGGGLISANCHGPAKFITPGSLTVKIEGKSVHLLGEPMLNNCGPSGSPPNTGATMAGADHSDIDVATLCAEAEGEAQAQADEDQKLKGKPPPPMRPSSRSVIKTSNGTVKGRNRGGTISDEVDKIARKYEYPEEEKHHDYRCAELNALSDAGDLASLKGRAVIVTVKVRGPNSESEDHGKKQGACTVCRQVLAELGVHECK